MSKMILMEGYHNLRFGYCEDDSESDFIDNINGKLNIHIAKGYEGESEKQHFFLFHNGKFISKSESSLFKNIDVIVNSFSNLDYRFSEIAKVLILSLYDREDYSSYEEVSEINTKFNEGYFEANETDDVSNFSPCFFGVGSVTRECDVKINMSTGEIYQAGEKIDNMKLFYGCVDEDETWVIGSSFNET
ncbi:hypothetical protein OAI10_01140 [bacterium]|nr:hypothetical protein [bacterium]